LSLNGLLNYSTDVLMKAFSLILSKLLVSLQFPKFEILNPHQTTHPLLFFLHYLECLKKICTKEFSFLTQNNATAKRQYGFRINHSTDLAVTTLYDEYINNINQLCPTRGSVEGFVRPSSGFGCSKISYILTACRYFENIEFDLLIQVVFSATVSRLLPLQLGFERFPKPDLVC